MNAMTQSEAISYFRSLGMGNGEIWHFMDGLFALGAVKPEPAPRQHGQHMAEYWYARRMALCTPPTYCAICGRAELGTYIDTAITSGDRGGK